MNIAIIRRADLGGIDGVNRFIFTLADGLRRLNNKVMVFGHHMTGNPSELFGVNIETRVIGENGGGYIKYMWDWYVRGTKLLKEFEPEILIVNGVVPLRLKAFKIAVNHGNAIFELRESRLKRFITKRLYNMYDRVIHVSSKVANEMSQIGIKCDEVIPPPILLENYSSNPEREAIILHVGTAPRKKPEVSIRAVEMLRNIGFNVKLILIGHYAGEVKDWLIIKSNCPDSELRKLYSKALVLMHPSMWEGLPYAVLEAQASGTPVIAGPGVPEEALVEGRTGFKIRSFDPKEYAEKLRVMVEDKSLWSYMSREARKYAEKFDHVKISMRYLKLYHG